MYIWHLSLLSSLPFSFLHLASVLACYFYVISNTPFYCPFYYCVSLIRLSFLFLHNVLVSSLCIHPIHKYLTSVVVWPNLIYPNLTCPSLTSPIIFIYHTLNELDLWMGSRGGMEKKECIAVRSMYYLYLFPYFLLTPVPFHSCILGPLYIYLPYNVWHLIFSLWCSVAHITSFSPRVFYSILTVLMLSASPSLS